MEGAILKAYIYNYGINTLRIVVPNMWVGTIKGSEDKYEIQETKQRIKTEENAFLLHTIRFRFLIFYFLLKL